MKRNCDAALHCLVDVICDTAHLTSEVSAFSKKASVQWSEDTHVLLNTTVAVDEVVSDHFSESSGVCDVSAELASEGTREFPEHMSATKPWTNRDSQAPLKNLIGRAGFLVDEQVDMAASGDFQSWSLDDAPEVHREQVRVGKDSFQTSVVRDDSDTWHSSQVPGLCFLPVALEAGCVETGSRSQVEHFTATTSTPQDQFPGFAPSCYSQGVGRRLPLIRAGELRDETRSTAETSWSSAMQNFNLVHKREVRFTSHVMERRCADADELLADTAPRQTMHKCVAKQSKECAGDVDCEADIDSEEDSFLVIDDVWDEVSFSECLNSSIDPDDQDLSDLQEGAVQVPLSSMPKPPKHEEPSAKTRLHCHRAHSSDAQLVSSRTMIDSRKASATSGPAIPTLSITSPSCW
eukprot:CAMPEP_0194513712 /NCGR_PEP_ID=MMETSP0253-20130528/46064_1 /TAXON_ID=2966 /ORGANISM="Noctiluca scintillans" /LENGTH=405 /DNA_ID=CAMNT_0039357291 /DNA_START=90 /DNA_END=1304 /DNA_ORIENTATION=+